MAGTVRPGEFELSCEDPAIEGLVESLEKGTEGGRAVWRFVLRCDSGTAVVELRGDEIHDALRDGDRVSVSDVICPATLRNESLDLSVTTHQRSRARQVIGTVATAFMSAFVSVAVAVITGSSEHAAPPHAGHPQPRTSVGAVIGVSVVLFVFLWFVWFILWGRHVHGRLRLAGTLAIAFGALLYIPLGLATR